MSVFVSYFWLWSIIGLVCLLLLLTLGTLLNLAGFFSPVKRAVQWVDDSPTSIQVGIVLLVLGLFVYPWWIHKLWAGATADQTRRTFQALPVFPHARPGATTEQMGGLYDPTGTDGTYIIGWYGTTASFADVRAYYEAALAERGWVPQSWPFASGASRILTSDSRIQFRDHPEVSLSHYELVVAQVPARSADVPPEIAVDPTLFALRLGVVDPRATTQVAWFIDCVVQRAPTFPSCEAMDWNPLERILFPQ